MIVENHISSKIIYDLDTFHSDYQISYEQDLTIIKGKAPVRYLMTYQKDFLSLTKGNGKLFYQMAGYFECHDQEKIIYLMHIKKINHVQLQKIIKSMIKS